MEEIRMSTRRRKPQVSWALSVLVLANALFAGARAWGQAATGGTESAPAADAPRPPAERLFPSPVGIPPQPTLSYIEQRSGLLTRFTPIIPNLPPDPKRDQWYDTRWGDPPNMRRHPNFYTNGGLFGLRWGAPCTRSVYPYFFGVPGQDTLTQDCKPVRPLLRNLSALVHPFKPVGFYYDQGSYVPVYDLDPVVPGPGSWPFPFFRRITSAGG
jgi:hypothetical protein